VSRPQGGRIFGLTPELASRRRNWRQQGLYNGFLARGAAVGVFGFLAGDDAVRVQLFFLAA